MAFGEDNCESVPAPLALSITTSVANSLLTVITSPGNLLICIAILRDPNKELRTTFNYLLLNVAISDLIIGAITDPIGVFFHIREALGYQVVTWYAVPHMSFFIGCTASLTSISMLAVERTIAANSSYHRKLSKQRVINMSIAVWVFSVTFPCLYFQIGYFKFAFVFSVLMLVVTFITIVIAFIRIHGSVRPSEIQIQSPDDEGRQSSQVRLKRAEYERRINSIFKSILIFYAICNVPSLVLTFIINLCSTCSCILIHWSRDLLVVCVLINCAGNQFLYAWRMRGFARAIRSLVYLPVSEPSTQHTHTNTDAV